MDNNNMYQQDQNDDYQQNYGNRQGYSDPQSDYIQPDYVQPGYQQQGYIQPENALEEPVTLGEWMVSFLLMLIPCVNIILMFVWAFSNSEKKSKSNFFKAALIWYGICMALSIIMVFAMGIGVASVLS